MSEHSTTVLEAQVDWITATVPVPPLTDALVVLGRQLVQTQHDAGNELNDWQWRGYAGQRAGAVSWGLGRAGGIIQASGGTADRTLIRILAIPARPSRLDLQVTVQLQEYSDRLAYVPWSRFRKTYTLGHMTITATLIAGSDGADTLYLGSPLSDERGRLYNKYLQSGSDHYRNCWRFETQLRGDSARATAESLRQAPDKAAWIASAVRAWWTRHGVDCPWPPGVGAIPSQRREELTDVDRKLSWLALQVRPVCNWLRARGAGDRAAEILDCTGWEEDLPQTATADSDTGTMDALA